MVCLLLGIVFILAMQHVKHFYGYCSLAQNYPFYSNKRITNKQQIIFPAFRRKIIHMLLPVERGRVFSVKQRKPLFPTKELQSNVNFSTLSTYSQTFGTKQIYQSDKLIRVSFSKWLCDLSSNGKKQSKENL